MTTEETTIDLWLVEDNPIFRNTVEDLLNHTEGFRCPRSYSTCEEALGTLENEAAPDVILMDIGLPGMSGIEGIEQIKSISPSTHIIILTIHEENENVFRALCAGASGYLLKSLTSEGIIGAIREVVNGGAPMNAQIARKVLDMFTAFSVRRGEYKLTDRSKLKTSIYLNVEEANIDTDVS